jgi:hypothetical protein
VKWYRPLPRKRLLNRYLLKATHGAPITADENAQRRSKDYEQAFARLSNDDKAFLRLAKVVADDRPTTEHRFLQLASELSSETRNISSLTAIALHPKYRQIVDIGWDVVPHLIYDLQKNKRYWLPALAEITKLRPYDSADEGNSKIMIDAWVNWGKKKYKNV